MKHLFLRHYQAIVRRGLINDKTTLTDFYNKLDEEYQEVITAKSSDELTQELCDLLFVCANFIQWSGYNLKTELQKNVKKQEMRAKIRTKILGIEFIIETIDNELNNYPELNRQIYLQERKEINQRKLYKLEALIIK